MLPSYRNSPAKRVRVISVALLVLIFVAGCTQDKDRQIGEVDEGAPASVRAARDAALAHVSEQYAVFLPAPEAHWMAEWETPGEAVGAGAYAFTSAGCTVTVAYPVTAPEAAIYHVRLDDQTSGIQWEGAVNASGQIITTVLAPSSGGQDAALPANLGVGGIAPEDATTLEEPPPQAEISEQSAATQDLTPHAVATASSAMPADGQGSYDAGAAVDGDPKQPWKEGVDGPGIGEWIMLEFPWSAHIHSLAIDIGHDRDEESFAGHHRLQRATLIFDDGRQLMVRFSDRAGLQTLPLSRLAGEPIVTSSIKLVIEDVYRGESSDATAIGEIQVWGTVEQ